MVKIRAPRLRRKPEAPQSLKAAVDRAKHRTLKRDSSLPLGLERDQAGELILDSKGQVIWDWPFSGEAPAEWPDWSWMLVDAFGTRNSAIAGTFLDHLMDLVGDEWDPKIEARVPDDGELQLLLAVVRSHKPQNEAQAAQAAQVAAAYIISMRVAKRVAQAPHDTRMVSAYARLLQAQATLTEAVSGRKGKRIARQSIKVVRETHVHHHQHVHVAGGEEEMENRGHATDVRKISGPSQSLDGPALSRNKQGGEVVRLAGRARKAGV